MRDLYKQEDNQLAMYQSFLSGGLAGGIAGLLTNPIDVVKTNLMTDSKGKFKGFFDCIKFLTEEESMMFITRGAFFRTFQMALVSSILFCGYETILNMVIDKHLHNF